LVDKEIIEEGKESEKRDYLVVWYERI